MAIVVWIVASVTGLGSATVQATESGAAISRGYAAADIKRGAEVFQRNCAECHGARAEGAPDWHRRGADGRFPAPPLNGTGHAWHHPPAALMRTIRDGTLKLGGSMPSWGDKLSDGEIEAVLAYVVSLWPDELYQAWRRQHAGG
jgi:mono/diheme cytochrome c family protein